jgi:hypothetical protein
MESSTGSAEKAVEKPRVTGAKWPVFGLFSALTNLLCRARNPLKAIHFRLAFSLLTSAGPMEWAGFPQETHVKFLS